MTCGRGLSGILALAMAACLDLGGDRSAGRHEAGLVELAESDSGFIVEAKYASVDNFLGIQVYPENRLLLLRSTAQKLQRVQNRLSRRGLRLKVLDAYRPLSVQKRMWNIVPDERYVADPSKGSMHNRGCAVDVTLVDARGGELAMPTAFDDFSQRAHRDFAELPPEILRNRGTLEEEMRAEGFTPLATEWWHFSDESCSRHPVLDVNPYGGELFPGNPAEKPRRVGSGPEG